MVEVKSLGIPPDPITREGIAKNFYTGLGAKAIIKAFPKENIKQLWTKYDELLGAMKDIEATSLTARFGKGKELKELAVVKNSDDAGCGCKVELTSEKIEFYQLDGYLLNSYLTEGLEYVIWTNGLVWRIFRKGILEKEFILSPEEKLDEGKVVIYRDKFGELLDYLREIFK